MPHISRQFLNGDKEQILIEALVDTLSTKASPALRKKIIREMLTGTERLMLAKRLAVICMLGEGVPFEDISTKLKVSSSTVSRLWAAMQKGAFQETIRAAKNSKTNKLVEFLEFVLSAPRSRHASRWKHIDEIRFKGE